MNYAISFHFILFLFLILIFSWIQNEKTKEIREEDLLVSEHTLSSNYAVISPFLLLWWHVGMCVCYFAHSKFRQIPVFIPFREMKDAYYAHFGYADVVSLYHFLIACGALRTRIYVIVCIVYVLCSVLACAYVLWLTLYSSSLLVLALIWIC